VHISRGYQLPANYLNFYSWSDDSGPHRARAITLAAYMRPGEQIRSFGDSVDEKLRQLRSLLPPDLIVARTSDQPRQVKENIDLFMEALYEAIALVVLLALIGFWEWRSAVLMALSMPITLAMTFGLAHLVHIDLQQVSIATLIIALGLLVDDPVVANDAIKRKLSAGPTARSCGLGRTDEAGTGNSLRHSNEHHCLPSVSDADRRNWRFSLQLAGCDDSRIGVFANRIDDLHPTARLLSFAAPREA
jgi:AcrB/AcrD/AcrF family